MSSWHLKKEVKIELRDLTALAGSNTTFMIYSVHFKLNDEKKLGYKYYNKRITTRDNDNVQSHDKEESKLNSTITANSGAHTLTHDQIIKKSIQ